MSFDINNYFTVDQFAAIRKVHRKTVYKWVRGTNPPKHQIIGRMIWIHKSAAIDWRPPKAGRRPKMTRSTATGKDAI